MTFLTATQAEAYTLFQTSRAKEITMSKTNDHARANRAYRDYLLSPTRDRVVLQELKARSDRYDAQAADARKAAEPEQRLAA